MYTIVCIYVCFHMYVCVCMCVCVCVCVCACMCACIIIVFFPNMFDVLIDFLPTTLTCKTAIFHFYRSTESLYVWCSVMLIHYWMLYKVWWASVLGYWRTSDRVHVKR